MNNNPIKKNYPHIVLSPENYQKLKSLGKMGDTFDKIVGDLLLKENQIACNPKEVGSLDGLQADQMGYHN